jgi:hypothetical protein
MQILASKSGDDVVLTVTGLLKKTDGMRLADEIAKAARQRPKQLILDCASMVAISLDSIPLVISALERSRVGKANIICRGCNEVVERSFRGFDFERVGRLE